MQENTKGLEISNHSIAITHNELVYLTVHPMHIFLDTPLSNITFTFHG
jgi:hypothetical protein